MEILTPMLEQPEALSILVVGLASRESKSTDLDLTNTERLEEIVAGLNNRPRKTLRWQTPHRVFSAACAA
jgi:hypothetical protein